MKFKHVFLIGMVFLAILTVGFVSASDNSTSTDGNFLNENYQVNGDEITLNSQDIGVSYGVNNSTGTFSDLNTAINESASELNLTRNYTYSDGDSDYIGGIIIDKQITINGNGFTIDGNNQAMAFNITASNVILNNITFANCCAEKGGAIFNSGTVTLNNDVFINNRADRGGAIFTKGNMVLNCSSFNNNAANEAGGAITISSGDVDLYDVVFSDNAADFAGAINNNGGYVNLFHVVFMNNTATWSGGAIYNWNIMDLYDVVFSNNAANEASAIANEYEMDLYDVVFSDNVANTYGAISNYNIMGLYGVVFSNNVAHYAGAISNDYFMYLQDVVFSNNSGVYGGAIYNTNYLSIEDSIFANATSDYAPAIYSDGGQLSISNTRFVNLTAKVSVGAISIKNGVRVHIEDSGFINTSSLKNAGAINMDRCGNVVIVDTIFRNTYSAFGGAFIQLEGNLVLNNSQFINDFADFDGGAVYLSYVKAKINNCTFDSNIAGAFDNHDACGGAVYCDVGSLTLNDSKFINNSASRGNAIYACDSSYNITNSIFINNTNAIYTDFDCEGYLDENNVYINSNVSTNNAYYQTAWCGEGIELKLINNTIDVANIPSRFDLREWGWVTPVKSQEFKGFCWVFGILAGLESSLLKATGVEYDFSENHIGNNAIKYGKYGNTLADEGGWNYLAVEAVLSWFSLVDEQDDCYDCMGKLSDLCAANNIHIQDVVFIPKEKSDDFIVSNETNNLIKQSVLKYGAVSIDFAGDGEYFSPTSSIYHNDTYEANHAVAVVGWDDSYSRDNFDVAPPGDGAWIIKSSWGSQWGDGGYGYLSYYDTSIFGLNYKYFPYTCAFIIENTENYNYNYQTDLGGNIQFAEDCTYYSNEYTSVGDDLLGAVGTYFNDTGVEYEFEVYVNGELRLVQSGVSEFAGFRTIILDKYIPLKTGDKFKVVFKSNVVPYLVFSRQHYLPNVSMISNDGKLWIDVADSNGTVCLKAYTVKDDTKIIDNNDISVDYAGGKYFTVRVVTDEGHTVGAGEKVTFTINKKTSTAITDENGVAKIKITDVPGKYVLKTTYNGKTYTNRVTVKQVLTTSKVTVKKTAKKFTLKATLKINGKLVKGKWITFKFNGKTYKVKTNAKGVAQKTLGKNVIKKLKKGKTYTVKVTYLKDTIKTTVKVR